jgi:hypothetical protein
MVIYMLTNISAPYSGAALNPTIATASITFHMMLAGPDE